MNKYEFSFSQLVFFKTMMETGSLTKTAKELHLSQATSSRNLARLRLLFDDPLFVRTRQGMMPTARADEIFPQLVETIFNIETLFESQEAKPATFNDTIRIGAIDNGVLNFISKVIPTILEKAPQLKIEIIPLSSNLYEKIESGSIHFAIYPEAPLPSDFHEATLYEDYYVCVVDQDHPLAHYAKINKVPSIKEIKQYKQLQIVVDGNKKEHVVWKCPYSESKQNIQIWTPYFLTTPILLKGTELIAILPYKTAEYFRHNTSLVSLPVPLPHKTYHARLIWHHRTHKHPNLQWLRKLIIQAAKES